MSSDLSSALECLFETWHFADRTKLGQVVLDYSGHSHVVETNLNPNNTEIENVQGLPPYLPKEDQKAIEVLVSDGWGDSNSPIQITKTDFANLCIAWQLDPRLLNYISPFNPEIPHFFEYNIEYASSNGQDFPSSLGHAAMLNLMFKVDMRRGAYVMFLCRYNVIKMRMKSLMLAQGLIGEGKGSLGATKEKNLAKLINSHRESLLENPMRLIGLLFELCEHRVRLDFSTTCKEILRTEGMLAVTRRAYWLQKEGIEIGSTNYRDVNARLYSNQIEVARTHARCTILKAFGSEVRVILVDMGSHSNHDGQTPNYSMIKAEKEVENTIRRLQVDLSETEYAQRRVESQFSILYNLIGQHDSHLSYQVAAAARRDSLTMKTISVLTMSFLPATFISTVFSTTIFDFQNWAQDGQRVVSLGWWIYLLCCVVLTALVFGLWYFWGLRNEKQPHSEKQSVGLDRALEQDEIYEQSA